LSPVFSTSKSACGLEAENLRHLKIRWLRAQHGRARRFAERMTAGMDLNLIG
jgi:hypothetical protein